MIMAPQLGLAALHAAKVGASKNCAKVLEVPKLPLLTKLRLSSVVLKFANNEVVGVGKDASCLSVGAPFVEALFQIVYNRVALALPADTAKPSTAAPASSSFFMGFISPKKCRCEEC